MTRASEVRALVARLDGQGMTSSAIAAVTGVSLPRVERLLDLDGSAFDDREDAPAIEPLGRHAPDRPAVEGERPVKRRPKGSSPEAKAAAAAGVTVDGRPRQRAAVTECGTSGGPAAHYRRGEKTCDACRAAWNEYRRKRRAAAKAAS